MADCIIGVPTFGKVSIHWSMSLTSLAMPINFSNQFNIVLKKRIDMARSEIAQNLLPKVTAGKIVGATEEDILEAVLKQIAHGEIVDGVIRNEGLPRFLFFLDDDVIMPPDTLRRLVHRMDNLPEDVGAISGVYYSKSEPGEPLIFKERGRGSYYDWRIGDFFKIWAAGCGLVLIRTEALRRMIEQQSHPLFSIDYGLHMNEKGVLEARSITEDLYFYTKMGKTLAPNGKPYSLWIDTTIQAKHFDMYSERFFGLQPEEPQAQGRKPIHVEGKPSLIWIGCGPRKDDFSGCQVTRVDALSEFNPDVVSLGDALPFKNETFDIAYSAYLLHTFEAKDTVRVLSEWRRILKGGGRVWVKLPDIDVGIARTKENPNVALDILYKGKMGMNASLARFFFEQAGFKGIYTFTNGAELNILGRKGE